MVFYLFITCIVLCIPRVKHLFKVSSRDTRKMKIMKVVQVSLFLTLGSYLLLGYQNSLKGPSKNLEATIKDFEKKFKDKTKNNWKDRADFKPCAGKYTLIEMDAQDDDENAQMEEKVRSFLGIIVFVCLFVCLFVLLFFF